MYGEEDHSGKGKEMKDAWKKYRGDFNAMTDEQIDQECKEAQRRIDKDEEWLEAVASWVDAGQPRNENNG